MRLRVVLHLLGPLLLMLALAMLAPLGVSYYYAEGDSLAFLLTIALTAAAGLALWRLAPAAVRYVSLRESFAIVSLGWILASAFGALPFMFAGTFKSYVDAYFETMSGFTTTGSSVLADIESQPHAILFWRGMTQWLGGMGVIALFVAIFPLLGVGAAQLFGLEAPGPPGERLTPRIRDTAKALWLLYAGISLAEVLLLFARGMPLYDAVTHTFTTMATGGYSIKNQSIAAYDDPGIDAIITFFMAVAGANFGLYYLLWRGRLANVLRDRELRVYLAIIGGSTLLVTADLALNRGYGLAAGLRYAAFQVASIQTTTGFATADFDLWPSFSRFLLLVLMFIGGCAGSTGGAMKVIRVWILAKYAYRELFTTFQPRAIVVLKLAGKPIPERVVSEVLGFTVLYLALFLFASLFLTSFGVDIVSAISAVAATQGNVGPGLGLVGPAQNYSALPDAVKVVLTFCMFAGRLEMWAALALFRPAFWAR